MKGEDLNKFDEFLRSSVGNYKVKPSPAIWKNIIHQIPGKKFAPFSFGGGNTGLIGMMAGGAVVTTLLVYHYAIPDRHPVTPKNVPPITAQVTEAPASPVSTDSNTFVYPPEISSLQKKQEQVLASVNGYHPDARKIREPELNNLPEQTQEVTEPISTAEPKVQVNENQVQQKNEYIPESVSVTEASSTVITEPFPEAGVNIPVKPASEQEWFLLSPRSGELDIPFVTRDQQTQVLAGMPGEKSASLRIHRASNDYFTTGPEYSLSAYYFPEWLRKPQGSPYGNTRQSGGLTIQMKNRMFSLETGLGIMKETGLQQFDGLYNRILGTYYNLQYIEFDSVNGQVVPTYHYSLDTVFDPKVRALNQVRKAEYLYLQLPLIGGLEKNLGRHDVGFKAGPIFSVMMQKKNDLLLLDAEQHVLQLDGDHPDRLTTTWQWYLGLSYNYHLTDRISLFLEPSARGYLNSPYENRRKSKDMPLYMGVRSGIRFQILKDGTP